MLIGEASPIATSAGCALVPVVPTLRWSPLPHQRRSRTDPSFVTQLIATAELINVSIRNIFKEYSTGPMFTSAVVTVLPSLLLAIQPFPSDPSLRLN
jgi:hypothetical protein